MSRRQAGLRVQNLPDGTTKVWPVWMDGSGRTYHSAKDVQVGPTAEEAAAKVFVALDAAEVAEA